MDQRSWVRRVLAAITGVVVAAGFSVAGATAAAANPSTTPKYPGSASATPFSGLAFDQCTAQPLATMQAWRNASPFRAVGVYIGGRNRSCAQPQLTAAWVASVSAMGWKIIPIYVGLQPDCGVRAGDDVIQSAHAASQGASEASDAVAQARALGLLPGSIVWSDIENYSTTDVQCRTDVLNYLTGWTTRLHSLGHLSGVYVNLSSGAQHLAANYASTRFARPDALWIARYDGNPALTGWAGLGNSLWSVHQRAKQFLGNVQETWGGATVKIDRDQWDAPVATVSYRHLISGTANVTARRGPSSAAASAGTFAPGAVVKIACQTPGSAVGGSKVWNKLTNGAYVPDANVDTASATSYTAPISRCAYPYQITASGGVKARSGPGTTYASRGTMANGSLAWITCQRGGTKVKNTKVWNKLNDGRWVSDAYVATPSSTTWTAAIPRC